MAETKPLIADESVEKFSEASLAPYEISASLQPVIDELGLQKNVEELRDHGYTVIEDVAPLALINELREVIHQFSAETEGPGRNYVAAMLLGRHPVVDAVATLPKILAIAEASVGKGMRASQFIGSIKRQGDPALGLHADQNWLPAPFPEHNCVLTYCLPCEGMTADGGATRVVPGSQQLRRHPTEEELKDPVTIPIEVAPGSVAVWDGSVWHSAGERTIPGTRTVLHATYQRLYTQPIGDYSYLLRDEEHAASASPEMLDLLGASLFYGTARPNSGGVDMKKFMHTAAMSKQ